MYTVVDISKIGAERWSVVYTLPVRTGCCGLKDERYNIVFKSKYKPTQKKIENEIKNQRKGL